MKNLPVYPNENPIVQNMELRDYFAAKAMQVLLPNEENDISSDAKFAYKVADAMLEARK
jgi:hypothetical protein